MVRHPRVKSIVSHWGARIYVPGLVGEVHMDTRCLRHVSARPTWVADMSFNCAFCCAGSILKYPLLLNELWKRTPDAHPDKSGLEVVCSQVSLCKLYATLGGVLACIPVLIEYFFSWLWEHGRYF